MCTARNWLKLIFYVAVCSLKKKKICIHMSSKSINRIFLFCFQKIILEEIMFLRVIFLILTISNAYDSFQKTIYYLEILTLFSKIRIFH
jgi:hypothetical protein